MKYRPPFEPLKNHDGQRLYLCSCCNGSGRIHRAQVVLEPGSFLWVKIKKNQMRSEQVNGHPVRSVQTIQCQECRGSGFIIGKGE